MPDVPEEGSAGSAPTDVGVVVVGGGPAGCSAGIFTARYGLETVVFDRGPSSLRRCAYLENYPGFPGGIDVDTFYGLLHAHARETGCAVVADLVETVEAADGGFVVETQDGRTVATANVVAATRYDASYLRGLGDPAATFRTAEAESGGREYLDPDWPDADGRTPVAGCYVATPTGERDVQAVVAAGRGAHVARALLADHRRDRGYPDGVAPHYDWTRPPAEFEGPAGDGDYWRDSFDRRASDDPDVDEDRLAAVREREVDRIFETEVSPGEVAARTERGHRTLAAHLDTEAVLDAIDDDRIRAYLDGSHAPAE